MADNEHTEGTEGTEGRSDKELNFDKLKEQYESRISELETENAELRPLRNKEQLRTAGFDPDSDRGKALAVALKAGEVEADADAIKEYASETFGWEPKAQLSETEQSAVDGQQRVETARDATESAPPPDQDAQIAEAEADGDYVKSGIMKLEKIYGSKVGG